MTSNHIHLAVRLTLGRVLLRRLLHISLLGGRGFLRSRISGLLSGSGFLRRSLLSGRVGRLGLLGHRGLAVTVGVQDHYGSSLLLGSFNLLSSHGSCAHDVVYLYL